MIDKINLIRRPDLLNYSAVKLEYDTISFDVHYWGIELNFSDNPVHKHSFFEVCYVLDGEGTYMENGVEFRLQKDTLFMSRPNVRHQIRNEIDLSLIYVAFEVNESKSVESMIRLYQALVASVNFIFFKASHTSTALIWRALLEQLQHPDIITEHFIRSAAHSLLVSFYSTFGNHEQSENKLSSQKPSVHLSNRAIHFIKDNLSQSLTLKEVADYLHLSSRHITRLFQQELGMRYIDFVQQERIRRAVHLLNYTQMSLIDIAEKTGYSSVHYFTRAFTKILGISPGKFRTKT